MTPRLRLQPSVVRQVHLLGLLWFGLLLGFGCQSAEDAFIGRRIENLCNASVPACGRQASCVLAPDEFIAGQFPGGKNIVVRTETEQTRLVVRTLISDATYPGTEFYIRAFDVGCSSFDEARETEANLFDLAGDDGVIEYALDVEGKGDHRLEFFSDLAAGFHFLVIQEE